MKFRSRIVSFEFWQVDRFLERENAKGFWLRIGIDGVGVAISNTVPIYSERRRGYFYCFGWKVVLLEKWGKRNV